MVKVFLAFAILATLAFVPSLTDFDPTQFDVTGNTVKIKAGATQTNVVINNLTNTVLETTNVNIYNSITLQSNVVFNLQSNVTVNLITNVTFSVKGGSKVVFQVPSSLINSNVTANSLASWDGLNTLTSALTSARFTFTGNQLDIAAASIPNADLVNSSVTINGTANQINGGGSVSLGGTLTLSTPQNINAGASPAFNAVNFTNWNGAMNTNNGGAAALVFGGPTSATGATLYETNITAATTLAAFDITHTPNTASGIKLLVSCTGGTDRVLTFPNGCTGAGLGTPPAVTITNAKAAWFDIIFKPAGTVAAQTNVFWSPVF